MHASCSIADCERPAKVKGMCSAHYQSERRKSRKREPCIIDDCDEPQYSLRLCSAHYQQDRRLQARLAKPEKVCIDPMPDGSQCRRQVKAKERCAQHYKQYHNDPELKQRRIDTRKAKSCIILRVGMMRRYHKDIRSANCSCRQSDYYCSRLDIEMPYLPDPATPADVRKMRAVAGRAKRAIPEAYKRAVSEL